MTSPPPPAAAVAPPRREFTEGGQAPVLPEAADFVRGRQIVTDAYVFAGSEGRLTVELRDGRVLRMAGAHMGRRRVCGTLSTAGASAPSKVCADYADVTAARPGATGPAQPDPSARANPLETR